VSQENVELVLAMADAYNSGDFDSVVGLYALDVEALPDASVFPEADPLRGRDEFRRWMVEVASPWVSVRWTPLEVFAIDGQRVLYRGDWGGVGTTSEVETYSSITGVLTIKGGEIRRAEWYFDHAEALKAVGLEE
jgi:ketosteroid isomerase-like protein